MQEYLGDNIISTTDSLPANLYKKHMDILKIVLLSLSILLLLCLYLMIRNNNVLNFRLHLLDQIHIQSSEDIMNDKDYAMYGLPLFKATALKYGFDNPIGDDLGSEDKYDEE